MSNRSSAWLERSNPKCWDHLWSMGIRCTKPLVHLLAAARTLHGPAGGKRADVETSAQAAEVSSRADVLLRTA